jgi:hypothetical protein
MDYLLLPLSSTLEKGPLTAIRSRGVHNHPPPARPPADSALIAKAKQELASGVKVSKLHVDLLTEAEPGATIPSKESLKNMAVYAKRRKLPTTDVYLNLNVHFGHQLNFMRHHTSFPHRQLLFASLWQVDMLSKHAGHILLDSSCC